MSEKELSGRVALVTGAGRNIGRAMAKALASGGAAVIVNVRSNKAEAEQAVAEIERDGGKAIAAVFDVADEKAVSAGVADAAKQLRRIDYLINNAALRQEKSFEEMSFKEWRDVLGVILDGAFHCTKACLPYLKASGAGAIVNIGGLSAHTGSAHRAHVTAAKLGLVGFTRGPAQHLGPNVTVNLVAPGTVDTPRDPAAVKPAHHLTHNMLMGRRGGPPQGGGRGRARRGGRDGTLPLRSRRALHHRADDPRQRRGLFVELGDCADCLEHCSRCSLIE